MAERLVGLALVERAAAVPVKVLEAALHCREKIVQGLELPEVNCT